MSTQNQSLVTAVVDGSPIGTWESRTGGEKTSQMSKRFVAGAQGERVYVGLASTSDVTITRPYERERDHELARTLETRTGRAGASISEQPLDDEGNPWGKPKTWTGKLMSVNTGDYDSQSGEPRIIELVVMCEAVS